MKTHETIDYKGCKILIHIDECPENPFEAFDCEPPIIVHSDRGVTRYNNAPDIADLVGRLPESAWKRGERLKLIKELNVSLSEFAQYKREIGVDDKDAFAALLLEQCPEPDRSWRDAEAHFETLSWLAKLAGISHCYERSNGYSQGHSALVIAFATHEWTALVGAPTDSLERQCKAAVDLYSAWAWGDCYGYTCEDENGDEIEDASCWGFYGRDHKESGLLESAENAIDCHLEYRNKETADLLAAVSR